MIVSAVALAGAAIAYGVTLGYAYVMHASAIDSIKHASIYIMIFWSKFMDEIQRAKLKLSLILGAISFLMVLISFSYHILQHIGVVS